MTLYKHREGMVIQQLFKLYIYCMPLGLNNTGTDCWYNCTSRQGPCDFCGEHGMCCTVKTGWTDTSNGCDGSFGGQTGHECVLKPTSKNDTMKVIVLTSIYNKRSVFYL